MRRLVLFVLLAVWSAGCGDSSGSKEEKPLPGKRVPVGAEGEKKP